MKRDGSSSWCETGASLQYSISLWVAHYNDSHFPSVVDLKATESTCKVGRVPGRAGKTSHQRVVG